MSIQEGHATQLDCWALLYFVLNHDQGSQRFHPRLPTSTMFKKRSRPAPRTRQPILAEEDPSSTTEEQQEQQEEEKLE